MASPEPHRSRRAWPGPMSVAGVGEGHTHDLPKSLLAILKALVLAVVVLLLVVGLLTYAVLEQRRYDREQQQYIEGRGELRDRENVRLQEQIRTSICDLLDQLPDGGLLDGPRAKYDCGPGRPLSEFPEDIQRRYNGEVPAAAPATTAVPTPTTQAPIGAPAVPNPPRPAPNSPPSVSPTKPPAAPAPTSPQGVLEPVIDEVCDLLDVCF